MLRSLLVLFVLGLALLAAWLWWARPSGAPDMTAYLDALESHSGSTEAVDAGLRRFESTFADLTSDDIRSEMRALYADDAFFNDTLVTLQSGDAIADYMGRTGKKLAVSRVTVHQALRDGADVFVRWTMHFESSAFGMTIDSDSIGMTHLRFDADGRIVLHQDFWDAAGGLYEHLPIAGAMIRTAKRALKK